MFDNALCLIDMMLVGSHTGEYMGETWIDLNCHVRFLGWTFVVSGLGRTYTGFRKGIEDE